MNNSTTGGPVIQFPYKYSSVICTVLLETGHAISKWRGKTLIRAVSLTRTMPPIFFLFIEIVCPGLISQRKAKYSPSFLFNCGQLFHIFSEWISNCANEVLKFKSDMKVQYHVHQFASGTLKLRQIQPQSSKQDKCCCHFYLFSW